MLTSVLLFLCPSLCFFLSSQVVETIVKVSPLTGTEFFLPVLLKIFHMILEVEVKFLNTAKLFVHELFEWTRCKRTSKYMLEDIKQRISKGLLKYYVCSFRLPFMHRRLRLERNISVDFWLLINYCYNLTEQSLRTFVLRRWKFRESGRMTIEVGDWPHLTFLLWMQLFWELIHLKFKCAKCSLAKVRFFPMQW